MHDLEFKVTHQVEPNEQAVIEFGIDSANLDMISTTREPINIYVYALQSVAAGVTGYTIGTNLIIKSLWVDNAFRSQGVARRLMEMIEAESQGKGCKVSMIDIMSYQPVDFFEKIGYAEMARLDRFHDDYDRLFMQKTL
jgi:ribosomal protein S18 acetylase RimI-like enzyme